VTGLVVVIAILDGAACGIVLFASTRSRTRRRAPSTTRCCRTRSTGTPTSA